MLTATDARVNAGFLEVNAVAQAIVLIAMVAMAAYFILDVVVYKGNARE
jgi:hypothetical protein